MREATFLWRDDRRHGVSPSVLIHLNTLTDNHRTHIAPALAARVPGTSWWAHHVLLPQDALMGYRPPARRIRLHLLPVGGAGGIHPPGVVGHGTARGHF